MYRVFFAVILVLVLSLTIWADEEDSFLFSVEDPVGDDYGPGSYIYPQDEVFQAGSGLFDLQNFKIKEVSDKYVIFFSFKKLTDPWKSKYGFSLPYIQLYIDNKEGGSTNLYEDGANIRLLPDYPWDLHLKLSGWWLRAYTPEEKEVEEDFWNAEEDPWKVEDAEITTKENEIIVTIKKEIIGELMGSHLYLLVGSFDPFGPDYFRKIAKEKTLWSFADPDNENLKYAPRVIDIVLPEKYKQEEVLGNFEKNYPLVYPLSIHKPRIMSKGENYIVIALPGFILLFLIIYLMYKKFGFSHNKSS